ncbi:dystroglycan-like [Copidosoma floridanum]|uniref:dystroglycan-like n=1 Tax=Copidosoma floridanum TaxID=29053 RepID=UPI0006C9DF50|nr:dystroglycan-like [Copidosoma floridanum]
MKRATRIGLLLLLLSVLGWCSQALSLPEDDLVFEDEAPDQQPQQHVKEPKPRPGKKWRPVKSLLGMPDAVAPAGHLFKLGVPKQAFSGSVDYYEVKGSVSKALPHWLNWDEPAAVLSGVPSCKDAGKHKIRVKAYGKRDDFAEDSFYIQVPRCSEYDVELRESCPDDQGPTMLTLLADAEFGKLTATDKVHAIENLAGFFGLNTSWITIQPFENKDSSSSGARRLVRKYSKDIKFPTKIQWQVGCDGKIWLNIINTTSEIPNQARDGTLTEVAQLPIYMWSLRTEPPSFARNRRDARAGSGDGLLPDDDEDDEEYDEDDYDENYDNGDGEGITDASPQEPKHKPVVHSGSTFAEEHPHRHHHGEDNVAGIGANINNEGDPSIWDNAEVNNAIVVNNATPTSDSPITSDSNPESSAPASTASPSPTWSSNTTENEGGKSFDPYDNVNVPGYDSTSSSSSTSTSTTSTTPLLTPSTTSTTTEIPTSPSTTISSTTTTTTPEPTTTTTTTTPTMTTTPSTTSTTERIDFGGLNFPPKVEKRLKKIPITQGKLLSYTIPEDTFSDVEDGNTRNLRLKIYEKGAPIKPTYWLQFNEETQEVYGLPLEEQYGTYPFEVIAMDREGLKTSDRLDISVQQHKQIRAVNHEFHVYLKIEKRSEFPTNVDWELKVMRSLAELYGDSDLSYITVRSIDIDHDQAIYSWTNDSLVRSDSCPHEEIKRLYKVLVADEKSEEPSERLTRVLGPEIRPKRVVYQGLEQCQQSKETQVNKYPMPRNQIDQLNATVGQLFVYRIPKDTFFDEEDGDTRSMKASLLTANRSEIPSRDWLQFDSSNQEFFGVPLKEDIGRKTYQLVVRDKENLEATDSLVAEVHPAPVVRHVVQISITLNMPVEAFAHSAQKKREFIQKLQKLYGDKSTNAISVLSITGNRDSTIVTWRNLTLPTYECPHDEITRLRRVLVNDNKSFTEELNREFNSNSQQPEFAVIQITVSQMGACQDVDRPDMPPIDDSTFVGKSHDDYLFTFVLPAVIIATMLILAGLIACILYKRRRSGKMSVSEKDEERQSFRSKGIPVIFQDELEEKPDPGNKSPIILKEEKPPLPPPEYQRAEDGADIPMLPKENSEEPYQPPPPFATNRDNNRQSRPKPTYRKPPPYVPP